MVKKDNEIHPGFEPGSSSDDSGDELKVKFAREVCYKVKDGTPGVRI